MYRVLTYKEMCMGPRVPQDGFLPPFDMEALERFAADPASVLPHLPYAWQVKSITAGDTPACIRAFLRTVGQLDRMRTRYEEVERLMARVPIEAVVNIKIKCDYLAFLTYATFGGAFDVSRIEPADLAFLQESDVSKPLIVVMMHFMTKFPGSPTTLFGKGSQTHVTFNGWSAHGGWKTEAAPVLGHLPWEVLRRLVSDTTWPRVVGLNLIGINAYATAGKCVGSGCEEETLDDIWRNAPAALLARYAKGIVHIISTLSLDRDLKRRPVLVYATGAGAGAILEWPAFAVLQEVHVDLSTTVNAIGKLPHLSCLTRPHIFREVMLDAGKGPICMSQVLRFAKRCGGDEHGTAVERCLQDLVLNRQSTRAFVEFVREAWLRASALGGKGGRPMQDFHYLLDLTRRPPACFAGGDEKMAALLGRHKYGNSNVTGSSAKADDVFPGMSETYLQTLCDKIAQLAGHGEATRWVQGQSGSEATQWVKGQSGSETTQWVKGQSGSETTQWEKGQSGNKATQWKSSGTVAVEGKGSWANVREASRALQIGFSSIHQALALARAKVGGTPLTVSFQCKGETFIWTAQN